MFGFSFYDVLISGMLFGLALGTLSMLFFNWLEKRNVDIEDIDYEEVE